MPSSQLEGSNIGILDLLEYDPGLIALATSLSRTAGKNATFAASKFNSMPSTKITVNSNGSLKIEGDFEIVDPQGNVYGLQGRTALGLCRCGLSKNKPFCDGSHNGNLDHQAVAFDLPPKKV